MGTEDEVVQDLRRRLAKGEWPVGSRIDTFDQLQETYPDVLVNVYRVRQVLAPLIHEGWLESKHGSGTWVRRIPSYDSVAGGLVEEVTQILADLDALRDRVALVHRVLSEPGDGLPASGREFAEIRKADQTPPPGGSALASTEPA